MLEERAAVGRCAVYCASERENWMQVDVCVGWVEAGSGAGSPASSCICIAGKNGCIETVLKVSLLKGNMVMGIYGNNMVIYGYMVIW